MDKPFSVPVEPAKSAVILLAGLTKTNPKQDLAPKVMSRAVVGVGSDADATELGKGCRCTVGEKRVR